MHTWLLRLLKIHQGEGGKVLWLTLIGAFLQAGVAIGVSAADSLFLTRLGAAHLPVVYCIMPILMVGVIPAYSYLVTRHGVDQMMDTTLAALAIGGVGLFVILELFGSATQSATGAWVYYVIRMYANLWLILVYTIQWTFIEGYFDILSAKRLFPVLGGGTALGAMIGGGLVALLAAPVGIAALFLVWAGLAMSAYPAVYRMRSAYHKIEEAEAEERQGLSEQVKNVATTFKSSPYTVYLNLGVFVLMFLTTVCEFQYLGVFEKHGNEQELALLFGQLFIAVNIFNLIMNFFLFNRLVSVFGVRNIALIQPIMYLMVFSYFSLNLDFNAAIVGFFVCKGLQDVVEDNNWNFLLNPVSSQVNKTVRALAEGVIDPLGSSLAGLFLLLFASKTAGIPHLFGVTLSAFQVSAIALGAAVLYLLVTLLLRHHYLGSMVTNLRREWLDFSRSEADVMVGLAAAELKALRERAASGELDTAAAAIRILWLNHRPSAVHALLDVLERATAHEQARLRPQLATMLLAHDDDTLRQVVDWLERNPVKLAPSLIEELGRHRLIPAQEWAHWLQSAAAEERAAAAVSLWYAWDLVSAIQALDSLRKLLQGKEDERLMGVRAIGYLEQERYAHYLVPYLDDASPMVGKEALRSIGRLADPTSSRLLPALLHRIEDNDPESRGMALEAVTQIGDSRCIPALLARVENFTPRERRQTERLLYAMGLRSIPATVAVLRDATYGYAARSVAARSIARLAFPQLQALVPEIIGREIKRAYQYLYDHSLLSQEPQLPPGMWVLSRFYADVQVVILEFVLLLLALGGRLPDYDMISSSLRSQNVRIRANAIEALEQACQRSTFLKLLPLVDQRPLEARIRFFRRHYDADRTTPQAIVQRASSSRIPLERSAAAQALWEGAAPGVANTLRENLHDMPGGIFRQTVISLLTRERGDASSNLIEMIAHLTHTPLFASFNTLDLATIVQGVAETTFTHGQSVYGPDEPADAIYVIKSGRVLLQRNGSAIDRGSGDVFGEDVLYGARLRTERALSQSASVYVLDFDHLTQCARTNPRIALNILAKQVTSR